MSRQECNEVLKNDRLSKQYTNYQGSSFNIIEYFGVRNCTIEFTNGYVKKKVAFKEIEKGKVKDIYYPSVYDIGYLGEGSYNPKNSKVVYDTWRGVLRRCYNEKERMKNSTYKDCTVDKRWHNFQNFAQWYEENYIDGFHLDKDILFKDNKVYSSETCCFVPVEINNLLTKTNALRGEYPIGVRRDREGNFVARLNSKHIGTYNTPKLAFEAYKVAKEKHIKEIATKWKGKIIEEVYEALINYKVEITD